MAKKDFMKYFKIVVLVMVLIFFTVETVQAQAVFGDDLTRPSNWVSQGEPEEETLSTASTEKRILDGDNTDPDAGDALVIEDEGEISTITGFAVEIRKDDNTVINYGTISTVDDESSAIKLMSGDDNTIINYGTISSKGENAHGIGIYGDSNTITNEAGGTITTEGFGAYGIKSRGDLNTLINYGTISTRGENGHGIYSKGDDNSIFNYGLIELLGDGTGIYSEGDGDKIANYGTIYREQNGLGISLNGDNSEAINYGTITLHGDESIGMDANSADNMRLINNGIINAATGMFLNPGAEAEGETYSGTMINNGLISAEGGYYSWGMWLAMSNSSAINTGTISAKGGLHAVGIANENNNNTITNRGAIEVSGGEEANYGIWVETPTGMTNTINNFGRITASGNNAYAIKTEAGNELVNLYSSSWILGRIDLGAGEDRINIYSDNNPTIAKTLTFEGAESINYYGRVGVVNGNRVTLIDPTEHAVKATVLNSLTSGLHSVIHTRLNNIRPNTGRVWTESFSSYRKRGTEENLFAYDHAYKGGMGGVEKVYEHLRIGVTAGFSRTNVEANSESFRTDTNSYLAGLYGLYDFGFLKLQASLLGGSEYHKSTRMVFDNLKGFENARSDFKSYFLSPSIMISKDYELTKRFMLRPSIETVYSAGWYDEYHEHGSTNSNLGIDRKTLYAMNCKAGLMATYQITERFQVSVNGGGGARYTDDTSTDGDFEGSPFRIKSKNDDSVYSAQFGANVNYALKDNFNLNFNIQHSEMKGDEKRDIITGGFQFNF